MKSDGVKLKPVIGAGAAATFVYLTSVAAGAPVPLIFALGFCAMAAMVWMAVHILKDPYSTDKTFDQFFYQDREDLRRFK